jgi:ABC-type transport system substrate-binding protein
LRRLAATSSGQPLAWGAAGNALARRMSGRVGQCEKWLYFSYTHRNVKLPYIDLAVYIVSEWKKIDIEAEHRAEESATWSKTRVTRDFELLVDPYGSATVGDPEEMLDKLTTGAPENWGRFSDPVVDKLFEQQAREMDAQKRIQLVRELDKRVLEKVWRIQGLWNSRMEVRSAKIRNYTPQPSHWMNRRFEDVWLTEK